MGTTFTGAGTGRAAMDAATTTTRSRATTATGAADPSGAQGAGPAVRWADPERRRPRAAAGAAGPRRPRPARLPADGPAARRATALHRPGAAGGTAARRRRPPRRPRRAAGGAAGPRPPLRLAT